MVAVAELEGLCMGRLLLDLSGECEKTVMRAFLESFEAFEYFPEELDFGTEVYKVLWWLIHFCGLG